MNDANDMPLKILDVSRQAAVEHARLMEEIQDLREELDHSRSAGQPNLEAASAEVSDAVLRLILTHLNSQDAHWRSRFENEHEDVLSLRRALEERSAEVENLRKRLNREMPMTVLPELPKSLPKHESEEIKGLKYRTLVSVDA